MRIALGARARPMWHPAAPCACAVCALHCPSALCMQMLSTLCAHMCLNPSRGSCYGSAHHHMSVHGLCMHADVASVCCLCMRVDVRRSRRSRRQHARPSASPQCGMRPAKHTHMGRWVRLCMRSAAMPAQRTWVALVTTAPCTPQVGSCGCHRWHSMTVCSSGQCLYEQLKAPVGLCLHSCPWVCIICCLGHEDAHS